MTFHEPLQHFIFLDYPAPTSQTKSSSSYITAYSPN